MGGLAHQIDKVRIAAFARRSRAGGTSHPLKEKLVIQNERIEIVEYLRGIASLAVAWFHFTNTYSYGPVRSSGAYGYLGVEVFFVISGFIIPYSLMTTYGNYTLADSWHFLGRRMTRLEPPYLLSIVVALMLWHASASAPGFAGAPPSYTIGQIAAHILYLVPLTSHSWILPVYWTLAYEFVFYISVAFLFPLIGRRQVNWAWAVVAAVAIISVSFGAPSRLLLFIIGFGIYRF
jgi:peptidoglycan/LPS O-acetylase OafA/YrhL